MFFIYSFYTYFRLNADLLHLLPLFHPSLLLWLVLCHRTQTQDAENMIEKMEQDEDVLIERLKKIQEEQRRAYELLQESLES